MKLRELIEFCLERLWYRFELQDGTLIEGTQEATCVPYGGYEYSVRVLTETEEKKYGSSLAWGQDARAYLVGEPTFARIILDGDDLVLVRERREAGISFPLGEISREKLARLGDIKFVACRTGGGWEVEFYLERLPGEKAGEEGDRWVGILHRSNGAVTVCRRREDFPF